MRYTKLQYLDAARVLFSVAFIFLLTAQSVDAQSLCDQIITKASLRAAIKYGRDHKSKRKSAAWYVERIKKCHVGFRLTSEEEREFRSIGGYLGTEEMQNLLIVLDLNYIQPLPVQAAQGAIGQSSPWPPSTDELPDEVIISLGENGLLRLKKVTYFKVGAQVLKGMDGSVVGVVELDGNRIYLSTKSAGFTMKHGKVIDLRYGWDSNASENVVEIVDDSQRPMFQVIYKRPWHIVLKGIIASEDRKLYYLMDDVIHSVSEIPPSFSLKRIFKYPSWKYPGQMAEQ